MSTLYGQALRDRVRAARQAQQAALDAEDAEAFDLASEEMAEARRLAAENGVSLADVELGGAAEAGEQPGAPEAGAGAH